MAKQSARRATQRKLAIAKLSSGASQKETAGLVGISEQTLVEWLKEPEFKTALDDAVNINVQEVMQTTQTAYKILGSATSKAALTLLGLLDSENEQIRLHATKLIFDLVRLPDWDDFQNKEEVKRNWDEAYRKISEEIYGIASKTIISVDK